MSNVYPLPAGRGASTRIGRTASRGGDIPERGVSPGRIFRTASRDSNAGGGGADRVFRSPPSKTPLGPSSSRFDRSYRSEGKPPAPASSRFTPERRIADSVSKNRFDDDSSTVSSNRENTDRFNVNTANDALNSVCKGVGVETPGKIVHRSTFWESQNNGATAPNDPFPPKDVSAGPATDPYFSSSDPSPGQSRGAYESARSSGRSERRDDVDEDTSNMPSVSSDRPTMLYSLIKSRNWDAVAERCHIGEGKSEAGTWVVDRNVDGTIKWRLLPLHQACEMQPPEDVVKALIVAYPPAVQMKDSGGDLPLHLACRERATKDTVHTLLRADPSTASITDDEGRLPLHLACRQGAGIDIVDDLLETYHRGAKTIDSYGLLPLHWACAQNATVPIVEALLRAHPYACDVKDKWGRTPLSLAHASTNTDKPRIVAALGRDPSYWSTSLKNEVNDLRGKLDTTSIHAEKETKRASGLEAKLAEVMAASSEAASSFQNLKVELEDENTRLRDEVGDLGPRIEQSEERIQYLEQRNATLKDRVGILVEKLGQLTDVFREMEDQRLQVLRVTSEWEESLHRAAELVLLDDDGAENLGEGNM